MRKNITQKMKDLVNKKQVFETSFQILSLNEKERTVDFVITTDDIDRHGEIVDQKTLNITHFLKAPRFLLFHDGQKFPIGKWTKVWMESNERGGLQWVGTAQFSAPGVSQEADQAWEHVKAGEMNTISIGFIPKRVEWDEEQEVIVLYDCELVEASLVNVPSNKYALAKSFDDGSELKGVLSDDERAMLEKTKELLERFLETDQEVKQVADSSEVKQIKKSPIGKGIALKRSRAKAIHQMNKTLRKLTKKNR